MNKIEISVTKGTTSFVTEDSDLAVDIIRRLAGAKSVIVNLMEGPTAAQVERYLGMDFSKLERRVAAVVPPDMGKLWEAQGGIYVGSVREADGSISHLVSAVEDLGRFAWADDFETTGATDPRDGGANLRAILAIDETLDSFPAQQAACAYRGGGHDDWRLPAQGELELCALNIPEHFQQDAWYWTSTEYSSGFARARRFSDGGTTNTSKTVTSRLVRPVRRFKI